MRILTAMVITFMATGLVQARTQSRFDLLCIGSSQVGGGSISPYREQFVFDLAKNEWCSYPCSIVESIDSVDDKSIMMKYREHLGGYTLINRMNAHFAILKSQDDRGNSNFKAAGTCTSLPFTGFPEQAF